MALPLRTPAPASPPIDLAEADRLDRIAYMVASAHAIPWAAAKRPPPRDARAMAARSISIAIARELLCTDNRVLAAFFNCADSEEVAAHCNRIAEREELAPLGEFAHTMRCLRGACASVLGLAYGENPSAEYYPGTRASDAN